MPPSQCDPHRNHTVGLASTLETLPSITPYATTKLLKLETIWPGSTFLEILVKHIHPGRKRENTSHCAVTGCEWVTTKTSAGGAPCKMFRTFNGFQNTFLVGDVTSHQVGDAISRRSVTSRIAHNGQDQHAE